MRYLLGRMGPGSGRPVLHKQDVLGHPRAPKLHEIRPPRYRLPQMEVETRRLRFARFQPRAVSTYGAEQDHGLRWRFRWTESNAIHHMPFVQGQYDLKFYFDLMQFLKLRD